MHTHIHTAGLSHAARSVGCAHVAGELDVRGRERRSSHVQTVRPKTLQARVNELHPVRQLTLPHERSCTAQRATCRRSWSSRLTRREPCHVLLPHARRLQRRVYGVWKHVSGPARRSRVIAGGQARWAARWGEVLGGTGRGRNATQSGCAGGGAGGAARGTIGLDGVPRRGSGSGVLQAPHVAARSWHL